MAHKNPQGLPPSFPFQPLLSTSNVKQSLNDALVLIRGPQSRKAAGHIALGKAPGSKSPGQRSAQVPPLLLIPAFSWRRHAATTCSSENLKRVSLSSFNIISPCSIISFRNSAGTPKQSWGHGLAFIALLAGGAPCRTRGPFPAGLTAEGTHLGSCPSCISLALSLASIWGYPFPGVLRLLVPLQRGCYSMDNAHCSAQSPVLHRASCWMQHPAPAPPLQRKCPELSLVNGNNVGFGSNTGFASNLNAYHYVLIEPD